MWPQFLQAPAGPLLVWGRGEFLALSQPRSSTFPLSSPWRQEMSTHPVLMLSRRPWARHLCSLGLLPHV